MRREGRQHGMVRTNRILPSPWNPKPGTRFGNRLESPPTAGFFAKVPSKPTNHSKFTGKCRLARCSGCHNYPACKSKDKTKGAHKLRSCDVVSNHRLVAWRVVDTGPGLNFSGFSASGILDHLSNGYLDDDYHDFHDSDDQVDDCVDNGYNHPWGFYDDDLNLEEEGKVVESAGADIVEDEEDDSDEIMSFCEVGLLWEEVDGDETWCLVGDM